MTTEEKIEKLKLVLDEICQMTYVNHQSHTPYCKLHAEQYSRIHAAAARALREIESDQ